MENNTKPEAASGPFVRLFAAFSIAYAELQYWLFGVTPEGYHHAKATAWEKFGNFHRTAKHWAAFLKYEEDVRARGMLAYCYTRLERWEDASTEYERVLKSWRHPSIMLGLAEAKLRLGDLEEARRITDAVESEFSPLEPIVEEGVVFVRNELAAPNATRVAA